MQKQAAILPKLVRLGATPIKGTPKLFMKSRSPAELQSLEKGVEGFLDKRIASPLESGLKALRVNKALGHGVNAATTVGQNIPGAKKVFPTFSSPEVQKRWAMRRGDAMTRGVAKRPVHALAAAAPVPGSALILPAVEKGLGMLNNRLSGTIKVAFADELVKIAIAVIECAQRRRFEKQAQVDAYQQLTDWSCSAACVKAVFQHYGIDISEDDAVAAIGTRKGHGAEVDELAAGARALGLEAFDWCFDSLEKAKALTDADIPIICDVQSFNYPGKGHYVVLTKIDEAGVHIMDPNTPGNARLLTPDHMDARWWDWTMAQPRELRVKWGVVILPPENPAG